jgi:hypothetical protein
VEVKVEEVHVKFVEHHDEAYKVNFNVITFQKVFESNTSQAKMSKVAQDHSNSFVNWVFDAKNRPLHIGRNEDEDQKERLQSSPHNNPNVNESKDEVNEPPYCLVIPSF